MLVRLRGAAIRLLADRLRAEELQHQPGHAAGTGPAPPPGPHQGPRDTQSVRALQVAVQ